MMTHLQRYLKAHEKTLKLAEASMRKRLATGKPTHVGDIAFDIARATFYETSEWKARAILSHALHNGAFGDIRAVRGRGIVFIGTAKLSLKRAA